ncbi:hypothetical protein [uncultured Winogradskyella sp.]|uniref:hypothetical protein n=1 Tax=uncultured Winogradskyella sp. TaxID=395353 RepID=UPI0030D6DAD8
MSIFGKALRGFGMLKKSSSAKKKFDTKRKVFGEAAKSNELTQITKKLKKTADEVQKSMARAKKNYPFLKLKD